MAIIPIKLDWKKQGWLKELINRATHSIEFTKGRTNVLLKRWTFNLNAAGRQTIYLAGNFIYGLEATDGVATVDVQFSRRDADQDLHPVVQGLGYVHPFDILHISWDAQTDKTLTIIIANLAPELFSIVDNRSAIVTGTLLTAIRDELRGDLVAENFGMVVVGAGATLIIAANANRKSCFIQHSPTGVGVIYLGFDNTVTNIIHFIELAPGNWWSIDDYRGDVYAIRSAAPTDAQYNEV